jgi:hypothetical protein
MSSRTYLNHQLVGLADVADPIHVFVGTRGLKRLIRHFNAGRSVAVEIRQHGSIVYRLNAYIDALETMAAPGTRCTCIKIVFWNSEEDKARGKLFEGPA